jgi:hypothetical protein
MQTIGGAGAILSVLFGLLGGKPENRILLRTSLVIGGVVFGLLALLGYRLGKRQDDCEQVMGKIFAVDGFCRGCKHADRRQTFGARNGNCPFPERCWRWPGYRWFDSLIVIARNGIVLRPRLRNDTR